MDYDFNLGAGQSQIVDVQGKFFKYKTGTGAISVTTSGGEVVYLLPGQYVSDIRFTRLQIKNLTSLQNSGVIIATNLNFGDDRIAGDVNVIDNAKTRAASGVDFMRFRSAPAVPGALNIAQLFNPVGSGKSIAVNSIALQSDTTNAVRMFASQTDMNSSTSYGASKTLGLAQSTMKMKGASDAVLPSTLFGTAQQIGIFSLTANQYLLVPIKDPIVIPPGWGLAFQNELVNTSLSTAFDFEVF